MADANAFLIYQDNNGVSNVNVCFDAGGRTVATNGLEVANCCKGMI